jgi:hypothetical protein
VQTIDDATTESGKQQSTVHSGQQCTANSALLPEGTKITQI